MVFVNGTTIINATWLNGLDTAAFTSAPQAIVDISNAQARILAIQAPGWAGDANFSAGIDWSKVTGLPTTLSGYGITDGGTLINVRTFTTANSGSAYVPTPGTNKVVVEVQGGGGAGGTYVSSALNRYRVTFGGQAGGYASAIFTSNVSGTILTIGAGGVSDGVTDGGGPNAAGKLSSFGTFISCPGGATGDRASISEFEDLTDEPQQRFGALSSGILQYSRRGSGGVGHMGSPSMGFCGGDGGPSKFGTGGVGGFNGSGSSNGSGGSGYGSGGGGGAGAFNTSGPIVGGNGAPGTIIIWEYA